MLVELSVMEQRYQAVLAVVQDGWRVVEVARRYVDGQRLTEGMLNRVEAVIRCYDPCLSCSTHALGQMALRLQLIGPDGAVVDELAR